MRNVSSCLLLLVLAATFSTLSSFSLKNLFHHKDVEGVDIKFDGGHATVTAIDPNGVAGAGAEAAVGDVTGDTGSATGKGEGKGTATLKDGTNITAFAKTTEKNFKFKWFNFGLERATGGFIIEKNGSSSEEKKEARTRLSFSVHLGNKTKTLKTPIFHF